MPTVHTIGAYRVECLPNGYLRFDHRPSQLVSVYDLPDDHRSGVPVPADVLHKAAAAICPEVFGYPKPCGFDAPCSHCTSPPVRNDASAVASLYAS